MSKSMTIEDLPAPRLQLRREKLPPNSEYRHACYYELVIPLGEYDIRREAWAKELKLAVPTSKWLR